MDTRVEPQSLLDHLLQVLHILKVTKRRIACRIAKYLFQFRNSFLLYTQLIKNINSTQCHDCSWKQQIKFTFQPSRSDKSLSNLFTSFGDETWGVVLPSGEVYCLTGRSGKRRACFNFRWDIYDRNRDFVYEIYKQAESLSALTHNITETCTSSVLQRS